MFEIHKVNNAYLASGYASYRWYPFKSWRTERTAFISAMDRVADTAIKRDLACPLLRRRDNGSSRQDAARND
jgi:hypothetical protein